MTPRSLIALIVCAVLACSEASGSDPLPSWNETGPKRAIIAFVERVTKQGSPDFVPPPERIATFDMDGTLWCEQPMYGQAAFVLDRVKALAPQRPEWKLKEPFASVLQDGAAAMNRVNDEQLLELVTATHAGMTTEEFAATVDDWIKSAKHPKTGRPQTKMIYQPMLELLSYLRSVGFKTFIVTGSGIEFVRPWSERVFGIPPEQVVGSRGKLKFEERGGKPVLVKLPVLEHNDDKEGKPIAIHAHIGRRPIFAAGNSDGDGRMLEWTTSGPGARFAMIVHHDDGAREWAYDRQSPIGRLDRGLDEAKAKGWSVVSMKADWASIFPPNQ